MINYFLSGDKCSRSLANTLQHYILCTFRKVLLSAPALLKSFREEGLWDLIFSEKFFYFGSPVDYINPIIHETWNDQFIDASESTGSKSINQADASILQAEAISFLEFAATLNENSNNLVSKLFSFFIYGIAHYMFCLVPFLLIVPYLTSLVLFVARMLSVGWCTRSLHL